MASSSKNSSSPFLLLYSGGTTGLNPVSISGLKVWFDANQLNLADSTLVSTWTDSSGNGNNATAAGGNRPTYKVNIKNSKPAVQFSGTNLMTTAAFGAALSQPSTVFLVGQAAGASTFMDGIIAGSRHLLDFNTGTTVRALAGSGITSNATVAQFNYFTVIFNGASSSLQVNANTAVSGDTGANTLTGVTLGANFTPTASLNGYIGEVLIYNALLSAAQITQVQNYIKAKWGL